MDLDGAHRRRGSETLLARSFFCARCSRGCRRSLYAASLRNGPANVRRRQRQEAPERGDISTGAIAFLVGPGGTREERRSYYSKGAEEHDMQNEYQTMFARWRAKRKKSPAQRHGASRC